MRLVGLQMKFLKRHGRDLDVFVDRSNSEECSREGREWRLPDVL